MWTRRTAFIAVIPLLILLLSSTLFTVVLITPSALAQEENLFWVSPGAFTVHDAPPMGKPWTIPQSIAVWNFDNIERLVFITVEAPPENDVTPGYEPIPNENWVKPDSSSIPVPAENFHLVNLSVNIPRWENLTEQLWEVWILFERQPLPGETITLELAVRMRIETAEELPPVDDGDTTYLALLAAGVIIGAAAAAAGVWVWSGRKGRRKPGKRASPRRQR